MPRRRDDRDDDSEYDDRPRRRRSRDDDDEDDEDDRPRRRRRERGTGDDAGMRMLLPVGRSGWAIAAGYLGLISVLCLPAPFALLAGLLAVREMNRDPEKHGMGRAVFGLVMGGLFSVVLALIVVALVAEWARGPK